LHTIELVINIAAFIHDRLPGWPPLLTDNIVPYNFEYYLL